jgi:hypothetical protein
MATDGRSGAGLRLKLLPASNEKEIDAAFPLWRKIDQRRFSSQPTRISSVAVTT